MPAPVWNVVFEEGSNFTLDLIYRSDRTTPIDVTGYGAKFSCSNDPDSPALISGSVADGRITVAGTTGQFSLKLPAASVTALRWLVKKGCRYNFTIWPTAATPSVDPLRLLQGEVDYSPAYGDN